MSSEAWDASTLPTNIDDVSRYDVRFSQLLTALENPAIAQAGCRFPNGIKSVSFTYDFVPPPIGTFIKVAVLKPTFAIHCAGGEAVEFADMSMTVTQTQRNPNSPFGKVIIDGR